MIGGKFMRECWRRAAKQARAEAQMRWPPGTDLRDEIRRLTWRYFLQRSRPA